MERFGLGYATRGYLKSWIAVPTHDAEGRLIAYIGRSVDEPPRLRFPKPRERNGVGHVFDPSRVLYNAHRLAGPVDTLTVVEGPLDVAWLWQNGHEHVVTPLGCDLSEAQATQIVNVTKEAGHIRILAPNADPGAQLAAQALTRLARARAVRWIELPAGRRPTDTSAEALHEIMG